MSSSPAAKKKIGDWSADDLERAAKYMRELDASKNAASAMELARREQDVEIQASKAKEKEFEAQRANAGIHMERVKNEEFRKNKEQQREGEKVGSFYSFYSSSFSAASFSPYSCASTR